jgi:signal transduction histidine kinase
MVAYLQRVARFARTSGLRPSPRHVLPIVNDVVVEFASEASTAFARVVLGETVEATIDVDPSWLRDVVRELVVNAREAAPALTTVVVSVREHEAGDGQRWAIVEVCDEGPGFAASVVHHAEEPFVSTKDGVRGAGFGLTLASAFADASGGRLVRVRDANITRVAIWLRVRE